MNIKNLEQQTKDFLIVATATMKLFGELSEEIANSEEPNESLTKSQEDLILKCKLCVIYLNAISDFVFLHKDQLKVIKKIFDATIETSDSYKKLTKKSLWN